MMQNFGWDGARWVGEFSFGGQWLAFLPVIAVWALFWKGLALWHAAKRGQNIWFIVLLVVNTLGILEIIYLFWVLKVKREELFK